MIRFLLICNFWGFRILFWPLISVRKTMKVFLKYFHLLSEIICTFHGYTRNCIFLLQKCSLFLTINIWIKAGGGRCAGCAQAHPIDCTSLSKYLCLFQKNLDFGTCVHTQYSMASAGPAVRFPAQWTHKKCPPLCLMLVFLCVAELDFAWTHQILQVAFDIAIFLFLE